MTNYACNLFVSSKVFLQGPLITSTTNNMDDSLRSNEYIPTTSLYSYNLTCDSSVFLTTVNNVIVDWIWVELRGKNNNKSVLHSQSALLQRDGDFVGVGGTSVLNFNAFNKSLLCSYKTP